MKVLLVDFGSTFVKTVVYDPETNKELFLGKLPFPDPIKSNDIEFVISEKNIADMVKNTFAIGLQYHCDRAYISVQMHGYLLRYADKAMSDYVSWRDWSGDVTCVAGENIDFYQRGTSLKANLPFVKLFQQKTKLQGAEFYTLGSYIAYFLTGNNVTHKTDACASGFFDAQSLEGDGLEGLKLPTVLHEVKSIGTYGEMEVYAPMGDHQISFLGSGAGADKYLVNVGTATQVSCLGDESCVIEGCESRPYFSKGQRVLTMSGLIGGDKIHRGEGLAELAVELEEAFRVLPPKRAVLFGGGGGQKAYKTLCGELKKKNIQCSFVEKNIGMEGLKWVSKQEPCCQK